MSSVHLALLRARTLIATPSPMAGGRPSTPLRGTPTPGACPDQTATG